MDVISPQYHSRMVVSSSQQTCGLTRLASSESSRKRLGILIARPPRPVYSPLGDGGVPPEARSSGVNCVEKADQQGGLEDVDEESSMTHVSGVAASC